MKIRVNSKLLVKNLEIEISSISELCSLFIRIHRTKSFATC